MTGQAAQRTGTILLLVAAGALFAGGCRDDNDGAADEGASTPTAQPPGTEPDAVEPIIEDLLARYDDAVNVIMVDQAIAADGDDEVVQGYLDVFEPGSEVAARALDGWKANAESGLAIAPAEAGGRAVVSRLDGELETVSADEVRFPTCDEHHYDILDADGAMTGRVESSELPGEGVAVRTDGRWYLSELTFAEGEGCGTESEGT